MKNIINRIRKINPVQLVVVVLLLTISCSEKQEGKEPPVLLSKRLMFDENMKIVDTVKFKNNNLTKTYEFEIVDQSNVDLKLTLENYNVNIATIKINNETLGQAINTIGVPKGVIYLTVVFKSTVKGVVNFDLTLEDGMGNISERYGISLLGFLKLPPVTVFTTEYVGAIAPLEYKIDASASYDQDGSFGGQINNYRYQINNMFSVMTNRSSFSYVFPEEGSYQISVTTYDNEGMSHYKQEVVRVTAGVAEEEGK